MSHHAAVQMVKWSFGGLTPAFSDYNLKKRTKKAPAYAGAFHSLFA